MLTRIINHIYIEWQSGDLSILFVSLRTWACSCATVEPVVFSDILQTYSNSLSQSEAKFTELENLGKATPAQSKFDSKSECKVAPNPYVESSLL